MAQHNPKSRAYLLIVLAAIVVCFMLAKLILGGGEHAGSDHAGDHKVESAQPAQHDTTSADDIPPRMQMGAPDMGEDVSPPDEMVDEPMLDGPPPENP